MQIRNATINMAEFVGSDTPQANILEWVEKRVTSTHSRPFHVKAMASMLQIIEMSTNYTFHEMRHLRQDKGSIEDILRIL